MQYKILIAPACAMFLILLLAFCFPEVSFAWGEPSPFTDLGTVLMVNIIMLVVFFLMIQEMTRCFLRINERLAILKEMKTSLQEFINLTHNAEKRFVGARPVAQDSVDMHPEIMAGKTTEQQ